MFVYFNHQKINNDFTIQFYCYFELYQIIAYGATNLVLLVVIVFFLSKEGGI